MNKDNNSDNPFFLCKNNDDKCKKLIEMIKVIVLEKLLENRSYINKNNQIAESVINDTINNLTKQIETTPYTQKQYEKYNETKTQETLKTIAELEENLLASGLGNGYNPTTGGDAGNKLVMDMVQQHMNMEHINMMNHLPHFGGNTRRKSYKKHKSKSNNCKKSKRIRKK